MPVERFTLPNHIELNARISARVYELMHRDGMDRHQDICQQYLYPPGGYLNISPKSEQNNPSSPYPRPSPSSSGQYS